MDIELTDRQRSVFDYIRSCQEEYGIAPTVREICSHLGLKGPAGVHKVLHRLIDKGVLISMPGKKRSWRLAGGPPRKTIPVVGLIAAGVPFEAVENREEELALDPAVFGCETCFALRVQGDSMIEAHIMEGDLAVIRPQPTAKSNEIVAVLVEDIVAEATLKILKRRRGVTELHAANPAYLPLIFKGNNQGMVRIIGRLVGLVRAPNMRT